MPENESEQTSTTEDLSGKVGECLHNYSANRTYYVRVEKEGKEFRRN